MDFLSLPPRYDGSVTQHPQWMNFKSLLKQKYIYENMTLLQVRDYMSRMHQFDASAGQYQRVFKKWQFQKNTKRKECEDIIASIKKRQLDYHHLKFHGTSNAANSKLKRALSRYDHPGLLYKKVLERTSYEKDWTSQLQARNLTLSLSPGDPPMDDQSLALMTQQFGSGPKHMETLPVILVMKYLQSELIEKIETVPTQIGAVLQVCKDISMAKLTDQHSIMTSLLSCDVSPDNVLFLPDVTRTSSHSWYTALQSAVDRCDQEAISTLLQAGSRPSGCSFEMIHSQLRTIYRHRGVEISDTKISDAVGQHLIRASAVTPLSIACSKPNLEIAQILLQGNASVNGCQFDPCCRRACSSGSDDTTYYECKKDCGLHSPFVLEVEDVLAALKPLSLPRLELCSRKYCSDRWGFEPVLGCAPLQTAVLALRLETVEFLLAHGADIEGCHGLTPLALATFQRDDILIETLLQKGADPFGLTYYGPRISAIAVAALLNDVRILETLLSKVTPRPALRTGASLSPWSATITYGSKDAYRLLFTAKLDGHLDRCSDNTLDFLKATIYFHDMNGSLRCCLIKCHAPEMSQDEKQALLQTCILQSDKSWLQAVLDSGANANDTSILTFTLQQYSDTQQETLDVLLRGSYGITSTIALEAMQMICKSNLDKPIAVHLRFAIQKLLSYWPGMRPLPEGHDIYRMLDLLLRLAARKIRPDYSEREQPDRLLCDVGLSLLRQSDRYNESRVSTYDTTPLQKAADLGSMDIVELLVQRGADINAAAAKVSNLGVIVKGGARVKTDDLPKTALQYAVANSDGPMIDYLLCCGADVDAPGTAGIGPTALQLAVEKLDANAVKLLLNRGANINASGCQYFGRSALQLAVEQGDIYMVELLLEKRANINGPCSKYFGRSALQIVVENHEVEMIEMLLNYGADIDQPGAPYFGQTALQLACGTGDAGLIQRLLDRGADVNWPAAHYGGVTALQAAAIRGSFHICQLLVAAGADVNADAADIEGRTAIEGAAEYGHLDILKWLLDLSAEQYAHKGRKKDDTQLLNTVRAAAQLAYGNNKHHIGEFLNGYASDLVPKMDTRSEVPGKETKTPNRANSTREGTSRHQTPVDVEPSEVSRGALVDRGMMSGLTNLSTNESQLFSDLLGEFVNTDMFE